MKRTDRELINAIKGGDVKVFEMLFRELYAPLCGYANKILHSREQAEETVQEVFYKFWSEKDKIGVHTSIKSFLYKTVYNKSLNFIEHQSVVTKYQVRYTLENHEFYKPDDAMIYSEMYLQYKKTLHGLPDRCRKIFKLSRNYNLKYSEIAEKLSVSIKTVEAEMGKALKAFRQNLEQYHITD